MPTLAAPESKAITRSIQIRAGGNWISRKFVRISFNFNSEVGLLFLLSIIVKMIQKRNIPMVKKRSAMVSASLL